jgi:drug/metabolite transporter (DMT)-like permease
VFATVIGLTIFRETLDPWTAAGAGLIVGAGVYSLLWEQQRKRRVSPAFKAH